MQKDFVVLYKYYSQLKQDFLYRNIRIQAENYGRLYKQLQDKFINKDDIESISEITYDDIA